MGRYRTDRSTEYQMVREESKRKRKANPSPNALRERIRAQHMKEGYQELQKTLPNVPPDTKLPRLNILLLAIDYISYLTGVLSQEDDKNNPERLRKATMLHSFIKKWPVRTQLFSEPQCSPYAKHSEQRRHRNGQEPQGYSNSCILQY